MFPKSFVFGTSTASAQIETASDHTWKGFNALDGTVFERTVDHEKRRAEDADFIAYLGESYRFSLDWARLQPDGASTPFDANVVQEYQQFLQLLISKGVTLMLVLHHFAHPLWFEKLGSFEDIAQSMGAWENYVEQVVEHFGGLVDNFNTFNEPNGFVTNGWITGNFPPHKKGRVFAAKQVISNMGEAHRRAVALIKARHPDTPVGISLNTVKFVAAGLLGRAAVPWLNWWFNEHCADAFNEGSDYQGVSYYAKIRVYNVSALVEFEQPGSMDAQGIPHDDMWEYDPLGLYEHMDRLWRRFQKPLIVTESGMATHQCDKRIASIRDYLGLIARLLDEGVPVLGYYHWSTMDNYEWNLGRQMKFGLVHVSVPSMDRTLKKCGFFLHQVVRHHSLQFDWDHLWAQQVNQATILDRGTILLPNTLVQREQGPSTRHFSPKVVRVDHAVHKHHRPQEEEEEEEQQQQQHHHHHHQHHQHHQHHKEHHHDHHQ